MPSSTSHSQSPPPYPFEEQAHIAIANQDILRASGILEAWIEREGHNDANRHAMESLTQLVEHQFAGGDDLWGLARSSIPDMPSSSISPEADAEFQDFCQQLDAVLDSGPLVIPSSPSFAQAEALDTVNQLQEETDGILHDLQGRDPQTCDLEEQQETDVGTDVDMNQASTSEHAVEQVHNTSAKDAQNHEHALFLVQLQQQAPLPTLVSNDLKRKFDGAHNDAAPKKHQADSRRDSFFSQSSAAMSPGALRQSALQHLPWMRLDAVQTSLSPPSQSLAGSMVSQLYRSHPNVNSGFSTPSPGTTSQRSYTPLRPVKSVEVIDLTGPTSQRSYTPLEPVKSVDVINLTGRSPTAPKAISNAKPKTTKAVTKPKSNGGSTAKSPSPPLGDFTPVPAELQFIARDVKKKSIAELQRAAARIRFHINEWQDERDRAEVRMKKAKEAESVDDSKKKGVAEEQKKLRRRLQEKCKGFERKFDIVRAQIEERGEMVTGDSDTLQWEGWS